jgi:hypothetical protein
MVVLEVAGTAFFFSDSSVESEISKSSTSFSFATLSTTGRALFTTGATTGASVFERGDFSAIAGFDPGC